MSITGLPVPDKLNKKSFNRRNNSGELDVFEAAKYFSGYNEVAGHNCAAYTQKVMREERLQAGRVGRISLDMPMMRNTLPHQQFHHVVGEKQMNKEKKYKQPSSPGGRLASFLNSLFNQTGSRKKKSKSTTTQSLKDHEEESPGGRRKRRSSISHFRSSSTTDSRSIYSSSSSGFRTPPPYAACTPTKSYKDLRSLSDHKHVVSLSKSSNGLVKSTALQNDQVSLDHDKRNTDLSWLDEKFKLNDRYSEKSKNRIWVDHNASEEKKKRDFIARFNDEEVDDDDGGESDSSSDLFELQNYELGIYSSGLPVYETTRMDNIKRGAPISNGAL